ncbi:CDP-diacylglycerol--serine O-phosphatidyltransferase [Natranaerovirga pectinivora]|uniref:CDP-diacylglycerol--serine O-phosphatidyltransferase n=1 Tax=Natranaerovirga pectinivora TaxID=682400 RepID=A0A4R3MGT4_9FIRM|nr:CDP-diacylglycerol--serine O-phosphatidyltransferase [Natranaerovirga pectinivora]TCT12993.1 CDP-diacylglycerol--serine O-phosphatidyltransferase [Natranaerovirga pectinivora]
MQLKKSIPNIITLFNICLGLFAIMTVICEVTNHKYIIASTLICVAAIGDYLDGKLARILSAESDLGKQLDSLSDLISFGVAPIIIAFKLNMYEMRYMAFAILSLFVLAGAYRLARYNISNFDGCFRGLPITVAGVLICIFNIINWYSMEIGSYTIYNNYITSVIIIILSYLMVSKIPFKKI